MTDPIVVLLNESMASGRGVTLAIGSGPIAMVVTEITETIVTGRSQEYDRIVVRLDQVLAAYM